MLHHMHAPRRETHTLLNSPGTVCAPSRDCVWSSFTRRPPMTSATCRAADRRARSRRHATSNVTSWALGEQTRLRHKPLVDAEKVVAVVCPKARQPQDVRTGNRRHLREQRLPAESAGPTESAGAPASLAERSPRTKRVRLKESCRHCQRAAYGNGERALAAGARHFNVPEVRLEHDALFAERGAALRARSAAGGAQQEEQRHAAQRARGSHCGLPKHCASAVLSTLQTRVHHGRTRLDVRATQHTQAHAQRLREAGCFVTPKQGSRHYDNVRELSDNSDNLSVYHIL